MSYLLAVNEYCLLSAAFGGAKGYQKGRRTNRKNILFLSKLLNLLHKPDRPRNGLPARPLYKLSYPLLTLHIFRRQIAEQDDRYHRECQHNRDLYRPEYRTAISHQRVAHKKGGPRR